jgi:hypothetical protein
VGQPSERDQDDDDEEGDDRGHAIEEAHAECHDSTEQAHAPRIGEFGPLALGLN